MTARQLHRAVTRATRIYDDLPGASRVKQTLSSLTPEKMVNRTVFKSRVTHPTQLLDIRVPMQRSMSTVSQAIGNPQINRRQALAALGYAAATDSRGRQKMIRRLASNAKRTASPVLRPELSLLRTVLDPQNKGKLSPQKYLRTSLLGGASLSTPFILDQWLSRRD